MRFRMLLVALVVLIAAGDSALFAQETEQDIINRYLKKSEKKQTQKLGWASINFSVNRINRNNEYNTFTTFESEYLDGASFSWLGQAPAFGTEFGVIFKERIAWKFGGEYWLNLGEEISGTYTYSPPGGTPVSVTNPKSSIRVYGVYTGVDYYVHNHPDKSGHLTSLAVRVGGTVGYYETRWDLWPEYENLNLSTSLPAGTNATFSGTSPGFTLDLGVDYQVDLWNLVLAGNIGYLHLNFSNVAWYNEADQEVVVSYNHTNSGRVDLSFSGIRGKMELKRFFSW